MVGTVAPWPRVAKSPRTPTEILIPDLVALSPYEYRVNPHCAEAAVASEHWLFEGGNLSAKKRNDFVGLKAGLLTSMCYPDAGYDELKVCCDYMNYLFHMDELTDDMDAEEEVAAADVVMNSLYHPHSYISQTRIGRMTRDYWLRYIQTASPGAQQRFIETFDHFFAAVSQQALDRKAGIIPTLDAYIAQRRDTSGCKPCWALIEYGNNLDLPDYVFEDPVVRALGEAANDLVTWSNDIWSYNVEQARRDTHNMIVVVMNERGIDLQDAVDFVGSMCAQSIKRFVKERECLPSWGPDIDRQVQVYVEGLANWIVGSLHWSFMSERYFGKTGAKVKESRVVKLLPKRT